MKRTLFLTMILIISIPLLAFADEKIGPGEWTTPSPVTTVEVGGTYVYFEIGGLTDMDEGCTTRFKYSFSFNPTAEYGNGAYSRIQSLVTASLLSGKNVSCKVGFCDSDSYTETGSCKLIK